MRTEILTQVSETELKDLISKTVRQELENLHKNENLETEFLIRKQVAEILRYCVKNLIYL